MLIDIVALVASVYLAAGVANQTNAADAPFQVVSFTDTHVRVDIGADRDRAQSLRHATVVTVSGAVSATLVRTQRSCKWLCGQGGQGDKEGRQCHYEAVLRVSRRMGIPIAVLAGIPVVADVGSVAAGAEQPIASEEQWIDATPFESGSDGYRWERFPDGVYMSSRSTGRNFYAPPIALASCNQRSTGPFTMLTCARSAQFLYEDGQAVAMSLADYDEATVRPTLRFQLDGKDAVLIRLGLKAHEVVALLVRENGRWRLAARAADYNLLC